VPDQLSKSLRKWMPFYPEDYLRDTKELTETQHGIYIKIILNLWCHGGWLPVTRHVLARYLGVDRQTLDRNWQALERFLVIDGDRFTQKRVQEQIVKAEKRRETGKNGAESRWRDKSMPTHPKSDAPQDAKPMGSEKEIEIYRDPPIVPQGGRERWREDFLFFWDAYPRKVGKGAAEKSWKKTEKSRPPLERILQVLSWQIRQPQWLSDNGKFIPHPATWLNQKRWEDAPQNAGVNLSGSSVAMLAAATRDTEGENE